MARTASRTPSRAVLLLALLVALLAAALAAAAPAQAAVPGADSYCAQAQLDDASCLSYMCGELNAPPPNYVDVGDTCVLDVCDNIAGAQPSVPAGMVLNSGTCKAEYDACPNLAGAQGWVPTGMQLVNGECVTPQPAERPEPAESAVPDPEPDPAVEPQYADALAPSASVADPNGITPDPRSGRGAAVAVPAGGAYTAVGTVGGSGGVGGSLPFTGQPLFAVATLGLLLLLGGSALHRVRVRRRGAVPVRAH